MNKENLFLEYMDGAMLLVLGIWYFGLKIAWVKKGYCGMSKL